VQERFDGRKRETKFMANYGARVLLFFSSYSPLFLILAIRHFDDRWVFGVFLGIAIISVVLLVAFIRVSMRSTTYGVTARASRPRDGDVAGYVVAYLLPFFSLDLSRLEDALSLAVLLVVVGVLYVHSNMVYVNPLLALSGYHLFEVEPEQGNPVTLLTKRRYVPPNRELSVVSLGNYAAMEKRTDGATRGHPQPRNVRRAGTARQRDGGGRR